MQVLFSLFFHSLLYRVQTFRRVTITISSAKSRQTRDLSVKNQYEKLQNDTGKKMDQPVVVRAKNAWTSGYDSVTLITWPVFCLVAASYQQTQKIALILSFGFMRAFVSRRLLIFVLYLLETNHEIKYSGS